MSVNINFCSNKYNYNSNSVSDIPKSELEIRRAALEKTNEEMNPERYKRNSKIIYGLSFTPLLLMEVLQNPGTKGILKFGTFIATVAGFGAAMRALRNNNEGFANFQKNNPGTALICDIAAFFAIYSLISRGLDSGGLYDKAANSIDTRCDKIKSKDFYKKFQETKFCTAISNGWNKFKGKLMSPEGAKWARLLWWSPLIIFGASIFRYENYKNKYRKTLEKNYYELKMNG